jgi:hypothetical protein
VYVVFMPMRLRFLARLSMLVLFVLLTVSYDATDSGACARHGHAAVARSAGVLHAAGHALVASMKPAHECHPCPPAECAVALPCASSGAGPSAPSALPAVPEPLVDAARHAFSAERAVSIAHQPPTPPPQTAA